MITPPSIRLIADEWQQLSQHFENATDGQQSPQKTVVSIRHDNQFLYINFECQQNPFTHQNTYTEHNSELWNQEVFEVFIAEGTATSTRYLEIEINPNNALFVGWIDNPTLEAPENLVFIGHDESGILHQVAVEEGRWSGSLQIPLALIGSQQKDYRLNFYRIVSTQSHEDANWKCSAEDCDFLCWNSTLSGASPRFHRPEAFGQLTLL
jgi:Carbohydrate-binding family 9